MTTTITQTIRPYDVLVATNWFLDPRFVLGQLAQNEAATNTLTQVFDGGTPYQSGTTTATSTAGYRLSPNDKRPAAAAGQTWYGKFTVKNFAAGSRQFQAVLRYYDTAGATLGTTLASFTNTQTLAAGATASFAVSGLAPSGTASVGLMLLRVSGTGAAIGDLIRCTSAMLSREDVPFFYGLTTDTTDYQYDYTAGTGSPSIQLERAAASAPISPQLLLTESFNMEAEIRSQVHPLLGDVPDDVDLEAAGTRRGSLQLLFTDQAEAIRGFEMHRRASLFELDDPDFGEMTYVPQGTVRLTLDPVTLEHMVLQTGFTEVTP